MSLKSIIQLIILIIIFIILGGVYFQYFYNKKIIIDENSQINEKDIVTNLEVQREEELKSFESSEDKNNTSNNIKKIDNIIKSSNTDKTIEDSDITVSDNNDKQAKAKKEIYEKDISNLVKDVEYVTTDKNGRKYKILAKSGKTNKNNKNTLDLNDVRGEIISKKRSTIYINADFAEYNSSNLASKFYKNVTIIYEDKKITCEVFEINMNTNIAIAYKNVIVSDYNSIMKAGSIILNIDTKEIEINSDQDKIRKIIIQTKN